MNGAQPRTAKPCNDDQPSVLIDGAQFLETRATGIASYARTLGKTLRSMGCSLSVLYGRPLVMPKGSPSIAGASQVFGKTPPEGQLEKLGNAARLALSAYSPLPGRITPVEISAEGVNLASIEPPVPDADKIYNASRLYEYAGRVFSTKQRLIEVRLDTSIDLAHWTGPLAIKAKSCPNVYTIHDLIPLQFPHFVRDRAGRSARLHAAIARDADLLITVSEASKRAIVDILKVRPERIHVTYQPVPPLPSLTRAEAERLVEGIYGVGPGSYAIFVGAIEPKKNLKRLIEAFVMVNPGIPLLIVGPLGWLYAGDLKLIESILANAPNQSSIIRRLGFVPRSHLSALLMCARFMAFPSIYEGFGLPVLEAMQMGVPVLTSNTSSLPEVAGDAALLIDPMDVVAIGRAIRQLVNDDDLRRDLSMRGHVQARKFGIEKYADRLRGAYASVGLELPKSAATIKAEKNLTLDN